MARIAAPPLKLVADFETTVYPGQQETEVWAAAVVEMYTEDVHIFHSLPEFMSYLFSLKRNLEIKFHNLKFDGSFILYDLKTRLANKGFTDAYDEDLQQFPKYRDMPWKSYSYLISSMGQWYSLTVKNGRQKIVFSDSLKLLPFSVKQIGKSFKTKHQKLEMEYTGFRYAGCKITPEEREYIANDVLVIKEALEIVESQGHDKMTIGSCCLAEYKKLVGDKDWQTMYPNMYEWELNPEEYGAPNIGVYCRRSYHGGWCYYVPGKRGKVLGNGFTLDVNSLYPSMMHSKSGNYYPVGEPKLFKGEIPRCCLEDNEDYKHYYYFVRIKCHFNIKPGKLPCIQIKNNKLYKSTEWLETSELRHHKLGKIKLKGVTDTRVTLTLTCSDWDLIQEQYDLTDLEILDGCYFYSAIGIFDEYIDKYMEIKMNSDGAVRTMAKLYLNNLYGKMAMSTESSFKTAYINDKGALAYHIVLANDKIPGYIPVGSAITAYSRRFTIRAAQDNFYGADKPGFVYADTDSIHCDMPINDVKGVTIDDANLCAWKKEMEWESAIFTRQKTYIEKAEDKYEIKCSGMPDACKDVLKRSFEGKPATEEEIKEGKWYPEQVEFMKVKRTLEDYKPGLRIYGKLRSTQMKGGTLLVPIYFEMQDNISGFALR